MRRVRSYLQPLAAQAHKWPEDAFVSLSEEFLYQLAIATDFRAGIASHAVQAVREFVPILNPQSFRGEARFRLGEVVSLICSYDASLGGHGSYRFDSVQNPEASSQIWDLIENAEFAEIVAIGGRIGYLRHPIVTFRRLRTVTRTFFKKPGVARMFSLASSVAELAGAKPISDQAKKIAALVNESADAPFRPPFIDLGSASLGVYRLALAFEQAAPASGAILLFEHTRRGKVFRSWLSIGEELKLQKEESDIIGIKSTVVQARSALGRFF